MSLTTFTLIGRAILLLVSFAGLCAGIQTVFKIDRFIAPFTAACGIITVLMLGGMLRILEPMFWLVYALGFVGVIYAVLTSPRKSGNLCWPLIAALVLFCAFLVWRFYPCTLHRNDDISHWGLVARHLLRYNAFPDRNAPWVFFQSYPLGSAAFIYYVGKSIGNFEWIYLIAQNFLYGCLFLPVLAHIQPKRKSCYYPIAIAAFIFLFNFSRDMIDLRVDLLLAFFGFGTFAAISYYRSDLKKALIAALPGMIAVVYIKNSGLFFAAVSVVMLIIFSKRQKLSRKDTLRIALVAIGGFSIAYLLWVLHLRFSFPAALETKHAVSISAYIKEASSKNSSILMQITRKYIRGLLSFSNTQVLAAVFILGCSFLLFHGCMQHPNREEQLRSIFKSILSCISIYAAWIILLYLMYIFSMPELEATVIAGFGRYNGTGLCCIMGMFLTLLFSYCSKQDFPLRWPARILQAGSVVFIAMLFVVILLPPSLTGNLFEHSAGYSQMRTRLMAARKNHNLQDGRRYAFFCWDENLNVGPYHEYYHMKYEFETADIIMLAENPKEQGVFLAGTREDSSILSDIHDYLINTIDTCDALIIMDKSETFEAQLDSFLETYTGSTPVIYAYEY